MTRIDPRTYRQCLKALETFPERLAFRHMTIALSAGGGVYKRLAESMAPRQSGTLSKSFAVKVSKYKRGNLKKPMHAVIGAKRKFARLVRATTGKRVGEKRAGKLLAAGERIIRRVPALYAHLAGPGRRSTFMHRAAMLGKRGAESRTIHKLQQGVNEEARRLAAENGVR